MKPLLYLFVFVLILVGIGFAFFTMTTPNIPQQQITKTLDSKDAFPAAATPIISAPATSIAPSTPVAAPAPQGNDD